MKHHLGSSPGDLDRRIQMLEEGTRNASHNTRTEIQNLGLQVPTVRCTLRAAASASGCCGWHRHRLPDPPAHACAAIGFGHAHPRPRPCPPPHPHRNPIYSAPPLPRTTHNNRCGMRSTNWARWTKLSRNCRGRQNRWSKSAITWSRSSRGWCLKWQRSTRTCGCDDTLRCLCLVTLVAALAFRAFHVPQ